MAAQRLGIPRLRLVGAGIRLRGYAVLQPNFRGSTGYGAAFQHAGNGQWGRIMQSDISDGLAALAKQGIVDPKRACIMGASYGGFAALARSHSATWDLSLRGVCGRRQRCCPSGLN
jgi:dienelactone hydrolase